METLGVWLRQTREARDETLEDVRATTRIKVGFLEMLEGGEFDAFPGGEVQVRGFLRIYARHLGLPGEDVLSRYEKETRRVEPAPTDPSAAAQPSQTAQTPPPVRPAAGPVAHQPAASSSLPALPEWLTLETIIIACIVLIIVLVILIAVLFALGQSKGAEQVRSMSPVATPVGVLLTPTVAAALPAVTPTFLVRAEGGVKLTLKATEHVWVRVTVDGLTAFEGIMAPGKPQTWSADEQVIVDTGNGAGLLVEVNDQPHGVVGERGQVSSRAWDPSGEIDIP